MQNWNDEIRKQLNNLPGFPAIPNTTPPNGDRWVLGEWVGECHVRPEVANAAALPLTGNELGDVRASLADQQWFIWDGAAWQSMGGGGGGVPAAPLNSVQFNNGGVFGGSANLTWDGSTLAVDGAVDRATAGTLTLGGTTANAITIGSAGVTTSFPGPVNLTGDVTTVGGTTFTTDATFEGNVTFGAGPADTVTFAALTTVTSDINFGGAPGTYKITNLANGTNPNDAVNFSQLSALVTGVSAVTASAPLASSGGATPNISLTGIVSVANGGTNSSSFTAGSVIFAGAGGTSLTQDNSNLFWDDGNNELGVRTNAPVAAIDLDNGQLAVPAGSAVAPSLALRTDLDTGVYFPAPFGPSPPPVGRVESLKEIGISFDGGTVVPPTPPLDPGYTGGEKAGVRFTKAALPAIPVPINLPAGTLRYGTTIFVGQDADEPGLVRLGQRVGYNTDADDIIGSYLVEAHLNDTVSGTGAGIGLYTYGSQNTNSAFTAVRARGTQANANPVQSGDILGSFNASGCHTAGSYSTATAPQYAGNQASWNTAGQVPGMRALAAENFLSTNLGALLDFYTVPTGSSTAAQRLRIGANGNVGIGTFSGVTSPAALFSVDDKFLVNSSGQITKYDNATPANGEVLIGNGAHFVKNTLTPGTGISITPGSGTITIAATGAAIPSTAQEALAAGDLVCFVDNGGTPNVRKADATNADARLNPVGFAVAAASAGAAVTVQIAGVADVPAARFDAAPAVTDVGKRVFVSTTSGQITLTAPSASGDVVQRVGVLVDGSANPKVLVQIGDPVLL